MNELRLRLGVALAVSAAAFGIADAPVGAVAPETSSAIISNGTVELGVWDAGNLNVPDATSDTDVGLRFVATGNESTAPGCLCEGWGVADATSGRSGSANAAEGYDDIDVESFTFDADSAVSVVRVADTTGDLFRVTHDYQPSTSPNLYEVDVTIENISGGAVDLRYRRYMDWDIEPTAFDEHVTIGGSAATAVDEAVVTRLSESADPLVPVTQATSPGDVVDFGPDDLAASFTFDFGALAAGATKTFTTFYGAAATEAGANTALAAVGAEVYSYGQTRDDPTGGTPNTFIFAFEGVGGPPVFPEICDNGIDDDGDGQIDGADPDCTPVVNTPPRADAGSDVSGNEGQAVAITGTASDVDAGDTVTTTWSYAPGAGVDAGASCSFADATALSTTVTCTDDGSYVLTLTASDGVNPPVSDTATLTVSNVAPTVGITSPAADSLHLVGTPVAISAAIGDAGTNDTHTCSIDWGDGTVTTGTVSSGTCTGSHAYAAIGTPTVTVTVTDDDGGIGTDTLALVIHDAATKVTGGGFVIDGGRTSFGFVAKPTSSGAAGQIQVRWDKQRFHGDTVTTLSTTAKTATWSGTGRLDRVGGYTFEVSVTDNRSGGGKKGTADTISIVIRDPSGAVVHAVSQPLKGGNITVH